jgi:retron-type reverse transcriptase
MCVPVAPASGSSIFSYRNIYERYLDCRRNKRNSINALKFEINAGERILELETKLKDRTYHPSRSILFAAKKPKLREIFAADFADRVVHHVLVHHLEKILELIFIHDSYACRVGKGTHQAITRLQSFLRKSTANGNVRAYYLQLDIKDFFTSIDKEILFSLLKKHVKDADAAWLMKLIIFWDCTKLYVARGEKNLLSAVPPNKSLFGKENKRGLPIGNLTSQFFANVYLNELDQFVKHTLKAKYYLRYVDDFVIVSRDRNELIRFKAEIKAFVESKLRLQLHPKRHKLLPVSGGIDFLGYIVRHNYILVRRRVLNNLKQKMREYRAAPVKDAENLRATLASYDGHFKWANTYRLKVCLRQNGIPILN